MSVAAYKELMIDAIKGGCPTGYPTWENEHLMNFTGNQHNPSWAWKKEELEKLDNEELVEFYNKYKRNF